MSDFQGMSGKTVGQGFGGERAISPYEDMLASRWQRRRRNLTLLGTLTGIVLALWLGRALASREHNSAKADFAITAAKWGDSLQRQLTDRIGRVSTTAAFFRSSDINDRKDFRTFVGQLTKNILSFDMLAWAPRIPAARRKAHEEAVRKEVGHANYVISQRDDRGRLFAAGQRKEYFPILFAEPSSETESLLGLDLGADPACQAAMRQATTTGLATMDVYTPLSGDKSRGNLLFVLELARYESVAGSLLKRPADQPETDGFVLGVLRMDAMAKRWLGGPALNIPPGVDVYISANGKDLASLHTGSPPQPFEGAGELPVSPPRRPPVGGALTSEEFEVAHVNFKIVYVATAPLITEIARSRKPLIATLTGLFITGLVAGYFWLLTGRMAGVQRQVADRWLELRERERYIRHLVENSSDAIFLHDEQGRILDVNRRACDALGYSREELLSRTVADVELPAEAGDPGLRVKRSAEEYQRTFQRVYRRKDGTTFPVEVHATLVGSVAKPLILAIVHGITDRT
jgi:PAS domain S-box-containing protein